MDSSSEDLAMSNGSVSSDFAPVAAPTPKARAKAAPKKVTTKGTAKAATGKKQTTINMKAPAAKKRPRSSIENQLDGTDDDKSLAGTPPKKQKTPTKKGAAKPLQPVKNDTLGNETSPPKGKKGAGATERYQKLTQLEHILKRPDTYVGSIERTERQLWVYNSQTESMQLRDVSYVPGIYKIFDEILVNAADNKQNDKNMDTIKVNIDREKGEISVWNNGRGIPIEIHAKEGIYIPEMIFGHLLTSSNYDDDQQKVTGGRNGFGAKLCNIFSTTFTIETADSRSKKNYKQTWTANMTQMGKAQLGTNKKDDYTKVTFTPDFKKFGMEGIDDDFEALVKRRVYDLAGTLHGVKVFINDDRIKIRNFKQYVEMYVKAINKENGEDAPTEPTALPTIITEQPDPRWEIGFAVSDGSFQQVSFVNSISTITGGTHVNYVGDQIVNRLMEIVKKKNKGGATLKPHQIRNHIFLFVNCSIVNPAFTSQTKEQLTTKASQFGSKCVVSDEFLKKVAKTQAVENILHFAQQKADQVLKKTDGHRRSRINNPKLVDANKAGTKDGWKCTLILTEGESAKGLAMAGRSVVGPDEFGVFPLRGKLLNVRDASIDQISKNAEIQSIKQFLGLQHKKEYLDTKGLRYGHIMIMTDQDHDGSHIKGLLINFLECTFPSLLRIPQFLIEFITPIVKVWKGDPKRPTKSQSFFTMPEYERWKEDNKHDHKWEHKYYKGLGTSTTEDAQVYFRDLDRHLKEFHTMQENEMQLIDLAFSKKKADERKEWLRQFKPGTFLDHSIDKITYTDFINKELILFSMADNMRSIPSVVDGLKPGQRKVLYTCFKRNLVKDMKVVELAGLVSGLTAYHHGDTSLQQTIVGLAQTFVGSNNINCLEPSGNFGSRLQGGSDCASARYIYTRLSPFARRIFSNLDDPLLTYHIDDNKQIEPEIYCPTVPLVLINGADGIGTGWSTSIPNYNPEDVVENLRRLMRDEKQVPMVPWFRGWGGEVQQTGPDRYQFNGIIKQTGPNEVEISELPIRMWTQDFKDRLEDFIKGDKGTPFIKDYTDYNTHVKVHFIVQMEEKQMKVTLEKGLIDKFKLSKSVATSNLVAFDKHGRLHKYNNVEEIMEEFYTHRLQFYEKRKAHQLAEMQKSLDRMTNQARFIQMIINNELIVSKKLKAVLVAELRKLGFKPFPKVKDAAKDGETEPVVDADDEDDVEVGASAYDYLLGMAIWSLTQERVDKLMQQIGDKEHEIDTLIKLTVKDLWTRDLDDFIAEWRFQLDDDQKRARKVANLGRRASNKLKIGPKGPGKRGKAKADDDSDYGAKKPTPKKPTTATRVQPKANTAFFDALKGKTMEPAKRFNPSVIQLDGSSDPIAGEDDDGEDFEEIAAAPKAKPAARKKAAPKLAKSTAVVDAGEGEAPKRTARGATKKPIKYDDGSDSESDGDDMLGDVSKMVKGIGGKVADSMVGAKPLFPTTSTAAVFGAATKASPVDALKELSDEDTDFSKLAPTTDDAPKLSDAVDDKKNGLLDSLSSSEDEAEPAPPVKPTVAARAKATSKPAAKKAAPKAAAAAPKSKKATNGKTTATTAPATKKKAAPLSPAAKAYAAKQAARKLLEESDSDDDFDLELKGGVAVNGQATSSEHEDEDVDMVDRPAPRAPVVAPPAATSGRPARRAAATAAKKATAYLDDSDSENDDDGDDDGGEEESFDEFDESE